jgi:hypothetical protein
LTEELEVVPEGDKKIVSWMRVVGKWLIKGKVIPGFD